jgi:glutathione S-transferase
VWTLHVNNQVVPSFYRLLQEQDNEKQVEHAKALKEQIEKLVNAADPAGPFFLGSRLSFVDVQAAPWILRLSRVMKPYRGWPDADPQSRWGRWIAALEADENVKATLSTDELYLDSYERYAGKCYALFSCFGH